MQKAKDIIMVGVDMGGTSLRALVVNEKDKILAEEKVQTNASQKPSGLISDIAALVEKAVHTVLTVDGPVCSCGHRGCAEALASRTAMERDVRAAVGAGRKSIVTEIMKKRHKQRMTSSVIHAALKEKDKVMSEVMERAQYYLGILAANVVNLLDPERVVIGGGIAERLGEDFVAPIRRTAYEYFFRREDADRVQIVGGTLGDNAGALGAVVFARHRLGN